MPKTKVLFFITSLNGGGTEKVLVNLVNKMNLTKFDVTIKCLLGGGKNEKDLNHKIHYSSIVSVKNKALRKIMVGVLYKMLPAYLFHFLFIGNRYDVEVAYDSGYPTKIIWGSNNKKSKKIAFLHGDIKHYPYYQKIYGSKEIAIENYKRMDKVCFVSKKNQETFLKEYCDTDNTLILHNVMRQEEIVKNSMEIVETGYQSSKINIVTVGRLTPVKGYDRLLEAVNKIGPLENSYSLTIIGCGECKEQYQNYITEHNLKWVRILDYMHNPFPYVKNADMFFCSSKSEGYSTAVAEAVLIGTPVITTDCPGMSEIFADGLGGRIVENSDDGIMQGLLDYLTHVEYRNILKKESLSKKEIFYSEMNDNVEKYESLISSVLAGK